MGLPRKYILYEMGPYNYCKIYKFNETYIAYKITVESWNYNYWNSIKVDSFGLDLAGFPNLLKTVSFTGKKSLIWTELDNTAKLRVN